MLKTISSSFALTTLCLLALTSCSSNNEFLKASSNELQIADDCRNTNKHLEMDCYDLISYKNSFAQLRLGLNAQLRGDFEEAIQRLNISKQKGNFYANAALADIYKNGFNDYAFTVLLVFGATGKLTDAISKKMNPLVQPQTEVKKDEQSV